MKDPDWFDPNDPDLFVGRTESERRFVEALRERARSWAALDVEPEDTEAWTDADDCIYVHVDVDDQEYRFGYGTMRVDYDGQRVMGHWGDAQFQDVIDPSAPDSFGSPPLGSPEEAANYAADWFEAQLRRPLERREWWQDGQLTRKLYVLADTDRALSGGGVGLPMSDPRGRWWQDVRPAVGTLRIVQLRPDRR